MRLVFRILLAISILLLALAACNGVTPNQSGTVSSLITLQPYQVNSTTPNATPQPELTASPSVTAEPVSYTVVAGDSLSVIASRFGVDLNALISANPLVNPNAMPIGTKLVIPSGGEAAGNVTRTSMGLPTPVIQAMEAPQCFRTEGSQWICFLLVRNSRLDAVGNVSGQVRETGSPSSFTAACPLDMIPAGESLPLIARIPNVEIDPTRMEGSLTTALPINETDTRFGAVEISNQTIKFSADHRSAEISGELLLISGGVARVLVFGQDSSKRVVGYRVWDAGISIQAGMTQSFHLYVYSLGDAIADIHVVAQARLK